MDGAARIHAPFTPAQVEALNAFTRAAHVRHQSPRTGRLCGLEPEATAAGWRCRCGWRQYWAWSFMAGGANGSRVDSSKGPPCRAVRQVQVRTVRT